MRRLSPQFLKIMKLTAVLLTIAFLQVHAKGFPQVTLTLKNVPVEKVFFEIERQAGYGFLYTKAMLSGLPNVTIKVKNASVNEVLNECFKGQPMVYSIENNTIVVTRKAAAAPVSPAAQEPVPPIDIRGRVRSSSGEPLQNVSVTVVGSKVGTTTNDEGRFTLTAPDNKNIVLEFSSVGYQTKRINIGNQTEVDVELELEVSGLSDVVVVGYGTVKKRDLTGSVSSVSGKDINAFSTSDVMHALAGRVAGVQVKQNTGAPGGAISVRIRGTNSIVGNNEPLYVVDGFPISDAQSINNSSIESVEILKDASAVAIYGSRASNGVVLITTKKGKKGESKINFESSYGVQRQIKKMKMMNSEEFGLYYNKLYENMGKPPLFTDAEISKFSSMGKGTDWQDVVFRDDAPIANNSLTLSGGNENTQFSITGSIFDQKGIIRNSGFKRYALNNRVQHKFNKALSVDLSLALSKNITSSKNSSGGRWGTSLIGSAFAIPPILPVYDDDGSYMEPTDRFVLVSEALYNPLNYINEQSDKLMQNNVLANASVSYKVIDNLVLKISGGIENRDSRSDFYQTKNFVNNTEGSARVTSSGYTSLLNENTLSYTNTFNRKHVFSAVAGFTYQNFLSRSLSGGGTGFLSDVTLSDNLATAAVPSNPTSSYSQSTLLSYLGRINYTFSDRYLFTASVRADGSSIYSAGNKWGYFPSAAFAWKLSEEKFFKGVDFIQDIKLRTSWGKAGSQAINPYSTLNQLSAGSTVFGSSLYTTMAPGVRLAADLRWETTSEVNFGLDWSLWARKVRFTVDYYYKKTNDLLNAVQLPHSSGYTNSLRNIGSISNRGFEFSISSDILSTKSFKWDLDANITFNRSKVLKLYGGQDILAGQLDMIRFSDWGNTYREGEPLGIMYGYREDGYDEKGYLKFKSRDKVKIGDPNPNFIFGLSSNLSYERFKLSVFLSGTQGNNIINLSAITYTVDNTFGTNKLKEVFYKSWTPETPNAKYPTPNQEQEYLFSDRYVEDGSYIRLRNVELSYKLPSLAIVGIKNAVVYISGQNLLTVTKYSWIDPDVNSRGGSSSLDQGIDYSTYPSAKSITGGVRIDF